MGLGLVAVLFADDAFELAETDTVLVGHLRLGVDDLALLERGPEGLVAHDDGVDDAEGVELVLVLLRTPNFLGRTTVPFWASSSPVRTFIKVDLPEPLGPVRP